MAIENRLAFINVCSQSFKVAPKAVLPGYDYGSVVLWAKKVNLLAVVRNRPREMVKVMNL